MLIILRILTVLYNFQHKVDENGHKIIEPCHYNKSAIIRKPFRITFEVRDGEKKKRRRPKNQDVGFFEKFEDSLVIRRICAVFDPSVGDRGAWTSRNTKTAFSNADMTVCIGIRNGSYGVMVETDDKPHYGQEFFWLTVTKSFGYLLSVQYLLAFLVSGLCFWQEFDMLHKLVLNVVACQLFGLVFIGISEFPFIRGSRDICAVFGFFIHFFFTAMASNLAMLGHALFK